MVETRAIDEFFGGLTLVQDAYKHAGFTYLAVKHSEKFVLLQGRVLLRTDPPATPYTHFVSENVRAGHWRLVDLKQSARKMFVQLMEGKLSTPEGELHFLLPDEGATAIHQPFFNESFQGQARLDVLTLRGANRNPYLRLPHFNWEVRGADTPFDGLNDLAAEYNLGAIEGDFATIEFVAFNVAAIEGNNSAIVGDKATLSLLLASGLDRNKARLGYRVLSQGRVVQRGTCEPMGMDWSDFQGFQRGVAKIDVPQGAVVQSFAVYSGLTQHHYWFADAANAQNPRRAIYQAFDRKFEILQQFFTEPHVRHGANDLEAGVAWLVWMLGFSVAHLGGTQRTRDAPDLIAVAPSGDLAVIECTTGLLKSENKLPLLVARAEAVRARLRSSSNGHLRVLPVIVTSMARDEIKADLEQAERLGVAVLSREHLLDALNRTLLLPNAQSVYDDGERNVRAAQAKYESKPVVDGS